MKIRSKKHCGGPYGSELVEVDSCWESLPPTLEEMSIDKYLKASQMHVGKSVLHIGTGNGYLVNQLSLNVLNIDTITISRSEYESMIPANDKVKKYIKNKYNAFEMASLMGTYDLIIDVNLKSFACCETHFNDMIDFFYDKLVTDGIILTAMSGVNFGWSGNKSISFTPGSVEVDNENNFRILAESGLQKLCKEKNLKLSIEKVENVRHRHGAAEEQIDCEDIVVLQKRL